MGIVEIFNRFSSWIKKLTKWNSVKSPLDKWLAVRQFNKFLLSFIGVAAVDIDYRYSFKTLLPLYLELNYFGLLFYTLFYYRNDPFTALKATPALGIFVPCLVLYLLAITPSIRTQYRLLYNFAGDYIYENSKNSPKNNDVCNRMSTDLITSSIKVNLLLLFSLFLTACAPVYKTLVTDEREMIIPVILPFVDPDTYNGFLVNMANQLFCCAFGTFIIPGTEIITCILKNTVSVTAAVIENTLTEFGNQLARNRKFTSEHNWQFRNIILKMTDFDRYVVDFTQLYYWKFFLQPVFLMYSATISIFLYLMDNWITGIGCAACCYIQLLILCDVGKTVDDANNLIVDALNKFPFYLLPIEKRKMYRFVLNRMQRGAKVRMGPFTELNYETATRLTKTMYTYVMFMLRAR